MTLAFPDSELAETRGEPIINACYLEGKAPLVLYIQWTYGASLQPHDLGEST